MQIEIRASGAEVKFEVFCDVKKRKLEHLKDTHRNGPFYLHGFLYFQKAEEVRLSQQLREETEVSLSWHI